MQIHLVVGEAGSYSDHAEWPVKAFMDSKQAWAFAEKLNGLYAELVKELPEDAEAARVEDEQTKAKCGEKNWRENFKTSASTMAQRRAIKQMEAFDSHFYSSETYYNVVEVELV